MARMPADISGLEQGNPATRWVESAERMLACGRLLHGHISRQAGRHQLSEAEFSLLWACRDIPSSGVGQNELAARLAVSPAQVSGLVERLRRKGLLEGHRPSHDRRRQHWQLTPEGRDTLQAVLAGLADWAGRLDEALRSERIETWLLEEAKSKTGGIRRLIQLLDRLRETFRSVAASPDEPVAPASRRGAA